MENSIKVGDLIHGVYKYGCVTGVVVEVKKSIVVVKKCKAIVENNVYTLTENLCNVTKSRIDKIGLNENESIA
jgi:hypothetical protein